MMNYSPLRYPGGKARLSPFIKLLIEKTAIQNPVYIEPYAGGAGVAWNIEWPGYLPGQRYPAQRG